MRFVTDLGKGILGKPDSVELWEEIISNIPDEVFLKKDLKVLCPACGHATEADVIVNRMTKLGRSVEEIKDSIYLIDKYKVFTKDALRKGYTNVFKVDFLDWKTDMKFDVVIGNPPYNWSDGDKQRKNNRENLWTRFITKGFEDLVKDNGYVSMVVPKTWMSPSRDFGTTNILNDYFKPNQVEVLNIDDCAKHFNVGSSFSYFVVKKDGSNSSKTTIVISENDKFNVDMKNNAWSMGIPCILDEHIFSTVSKFFNSKHDKFGWLKQYEGQVDNFKSVSGYNVFHTPASVGKTFSEEKSYLHNKSKVMVSLSGKYAPYYDNGDCSPSGMVVCLLLGKDESTDNAKTLFDSKLYKLMVDKVFRYNGWINGNVLKSLPKLDLTTSWTDNEIYDYFGLTSDEKQAIEKYS